MNENEEISGIPDEATAERSVLRLGQIFQGKPVAILRWVWRSSHLWRVATLIALTFIGYLTINTHGPIAHFRDSNPEVNGYVPPRDFEAVLKKLDESVVTIYCDLSKDKGSLGTAWSLEYPDITNGGRSALMTNHHVIEDCIGQGELSLEDVWGDTFDARIESYDEENDLAIVSTDHKIRPLKLASYPPAVGYWVMAYGAADGYNGSVAFGNILNITTGNDILVTAALSHGNSGGPLVDNEGNVFGVSTSTMNGEQYNIVGSLDRFCASLVVCEGDTYWDWG